MDKEKLIKQIMAECAKDGEPVTYEEAAEMALSKNIAERLSNQSLFLIGGTRWVAACRTFHCTTLRRFCQAIFEKKLHKFLSRILCILTITIPSCVCYTCIIEREIQNRKSRRLKKSQKTLKKVLTNKTAYDIINT